MPSGSVFSIALTCKSLRKLAEELQHEGHTVSYQTVADPKQSEPVISVDEKKHLVEHFKNAGRQWQPKGQT